MERIDAKTCASRSIAKEISRHIRNGSLSRSYLLEHYKRRELVWKKDDPLKVNRDGLALKSLYSILQIGVFFTCKGKIALFKRPQKERDGSKKITGNFSAIKSWSPASLDEDDLSADLAERVHMQAGPILDWKAAGLATTDIFEAQNPLTPHYVFILFEIPLDDTSRLDTKKHPNLRKNTEHFVGWFDPAEYNYHNFQGEFYDPLEEEHVPIRFDGAVDRLLLKSAQNGAAVPLEDTTRGLSRYFPESAVEANTLETSFSASGLNFDEHTKHFLSVSQAIQKTSGTPEQEVTIQDVIMFEPNFAGLGIHGKEFISWVKKMYRRAFK